MLYMLQFEHGNRIKVLVASGLNNKLKANIIALNMSSFPFPAKQNLETQHFFV